MRWLEALSDFHPGMKIQHQSGKSNIPADLLSRRVELFRKYSVGRAKLPRTNKGRIIAG